MTLRASSPKNEICDNLLIRSKPKAFLYKPKDIFINLSFLSIHCNCNLQAQKSNLYELCNESFNKSILKRYDHILYDKQISFRIHSDYSLLDEAPRCDGASVHFAGIIKCK